MKRPAALILVGVTVAAVLGRLRCLAGLIVEHAENSKAVAGSGRERAAVLAATFPSPTPSASPATSRQDPGHGTDASGSQRAESAGRAGQRDGKDDKNRESRRGKLGRGKDRPGTSKNTSRFRCPDAHLSQSSARRGLGPARPCLGWPPLVRAAATAVRKRSRLSLAGLASRVRWLLAALPTPMAVGRGMLFLPIAPGAVWSGVLTLAGDVVGVTSRFNRSLRRHRIRLLAPVRALADLGGSARVIVDRARSRGRFRYSRRPCALALAGRPDSGSVAGTGGRLSTRRG